VYIVAIARRCAEQYRNTPAGHFSSYKDGAKKRNILFDLTFDEFETFWDAACCYCRDSIKDIGLDRVDNDKGY